MAHWKTATISLLGGLLLGVLVMPQLPFTTAGAADDKPAATAAPRDVHSYRDIVKKVLPAVVSIQVTSKPARAARAAPPAEEAVPDDFPNELRKYLEELRKRGADMDTEPAWQFGSGVVVDPKGIIVTSHHVVAGAQQVEVMFKNGTRYSSKAVHSDPKTDVAIVKISAPGSMPYLEFGDSEAMEIGDRVLAVGAPFGLDGSVTHGIISGTGRRMDGTLLYEDFLQTDAAINPGNSGGPLINMEGKVIGINTAIKSRSGGFQGVGLATPSSIVRGVVEQLAKDGVVKRGYLGIQMQELTPDVAERLGLTGQKGLLVSRVFPETPAAKAGLKEGDVIVAVHGRPIDTSRALQRIVERTPINSPMNVTLLRNGKRETIQVTIEQQPETYGVTGFDPPRRVAKPDTETVSLAKVGLEVADVTAEMAEPLGLKDAKGAVITKVEAAGVAQLVGLRRGMVILQADRKPVESAKHLKELLAKASLEDGVLLMVRAPQGGTRYIILKASE